jgi:hypothetical protein
MGVLGLVQKGVRVALKKYEQDLLNGQQGMVCWRSVRLLGKAVTEVGIDLAELVYD